MYFRAGTQFNPKSKAPTTYERGQETVNRLPDPLHDRPHPLGKERRSG
jgi:hypothetical protein